MEARQKRIRLDCREDTHKAGENREDAGKLESAHKCSRTHSTAPSMVKGDPDSRAVKSGRLKSAPVPQRHASLYRLVISKAW